MTEPGTSKAAGTDPQNEIDPTAFFAGYQALAPLGGDREPVIHALQAGYDFKAEAPKGPDIGSLVSSSPAQKQGFKLGGNN